MPECRSRSHEARRYSRLPSAGLSELVDLSNDEFPLDPPQSIDEQRAVEMIHLVLKRARQQLAPLDGLFIARSIQPADNRSRGPDNGRIETGNAEASFFFDLHALPLDENRIDQDDEVGRATADGEVDHEQ